MTKLLGYIAALVLTVSLILLFGLSAIPVLLVIGALYLAELSAQHRERWRRDKYLR